MALRSDTFMPNLLPSLTKILLLPSAQVFGILLT
jgi:hypothetical protein